MKFRFIQTIFMGILLYNHNHVISPIYAAGSSTKPIIKMAKSLLKTNDNMLTASSIEAFQLKINDQYQASDGSIVKRSLIKLVPDSQSMFTLGQETLQLGGDIDGRNQKISRSLSVYGRPYGNYNAGCTLCVFSGADSFYNGGGQAAISGIDYRGGANAVANGDMATVGFYHYDENASARVVTQAVSFGPGVVTLASPMTNEQMSLLHQGMYVATNVIDPNYPVDRNFIRSNAYWGFVKSWDATHIYVYDWAVLGRNNSAGGQIPNIQYLERNLSTYKVPMIFVGVSAKIFAENEYMVADGSKVLGDKASSVANSFEREELDFRARNWLKSKSLSFHGWTVSFECRPNCDHNAVSEDSYAYLVNGPDGLPKAYVAQMQGDALEYLGYSTFIGGNGGPESVDENGNISQAVVGSNHIMSSFASVLPGNNTIHISTIVNREKVQMQDWRDYSVRFLMDVDSQRDRKKGLYTGSRMGSVVFNYNASHNGGICLLGYDKNQGLCQEGDGSVSFAQPVTLNSQIFMGEHQLLSFKNSKNSNAVYLFTDEQGDLNLGTQISNGSNIHGVNGYYGKSVTLSDQITTPKIIAHQIIGHLSTPYSSSASCIPGEFKDDTNYHYVCVSTNHWKRSLLSDF